MSVDNFINELQERSLLSDRMMGKLREAVADPTRPLSARTLAKFLVQKNHLSQRDATDIINALKVAGVDVDKIGPPSTIITAAQLMPDANEDDAEGSSIFAPFLAGGGAKKTGPAPADDEDELTLVAIDDDEAGAPQAVDDEVEVEEDVPILGTIVPPEDTAPRRRDEVRSVEPPTSRPTDTPDEPAAADSGEMPDDEPPAPRRGKKKDSAFREGRKSRKKPTLKKKQWDSPLMLYGGGGLALLLLIGAGAFWLLIWEKGDQELKRAKTALDAGAFDDAITHYQQFLENSPRHPERGKARVELALARIRQASESSNFSKALEIAPKELEAVEDEKSFSDAHGDLASLLPDIALGLATQAKEAGAGAENADKLVAESRAALDLCNNISYIPKSLLDVGKLTQVRELLQQVEHREQSFKALQETLAAMEKAIADGDAATSFTAHKKLVKERPELAGDSKLVEMIKKTSVADQAAVKFVSEEQAAETTDRPTPWVASLALAQRRAGPAGPAGPPGAVACVRVESAIYGLDSATGKLIWRRYVGYSPSAWPLAIGNDVLVTDARHHELCRLNAATGKLVWRQAIGESFSEPLVVGPRAFVAAKSGRLFIVDLASGARAGYLQFPQPLAAPPTADRRQQRLYLPGDQFSLYSISLSDLKCIGSYYFGHEPTSIRLAPAQLLNKLAVLENDGLETSRLHVLSLDDNGAVAGEEIEQRLAGLAASPLLVEGRRLIAITDRGGVDVYEIGAGKGKEALAPVATRKPTDKQPIVRYVTVSSGYLWVGDTQLTKYAILPTGDRLPVESIQNNFAGDAFDHPLQLFGDTLVSVRRAKRRAGVVVAATDVKQGRALWETDLAVPPAAAPVVDPSGRALAVANANGFVFRFDAAAIRSRVQDEPLAAQSTPAQVKPLSGGADLGDGKAAFYAIDSEQLLLYDPAAGESPARWAELPSPLACAVTPFAGGVLAPLKIGQIFLLNPSNGEQLAAPFQPRLEPRTVVEYRPAGVGSAADRRFVISDGQEKLYLVNLVDTPQPHLEGVAEGKVSPMKITSPVAVLGELAIAAAEGGHLLRYKLPSLEAAGDVALPGEAVWGPFRVGEQALLATADEQLVAVSPNGEVAWKAALEHGELAGPPLAVEGGVLLAFRKGIVERRNMADGKPAAKRDVEHPLAAGPVRFMQRLVLAADDGTLLVVDQP